MTSLRLFNPRGSRVSDFKSRRLFVPTVEQSERRVLMSVNASRLQSGSAVQSKPTASHLQKLHTSLPDGSVGALTHFARAGQASREPAQVSALPISPDAAIKFRGRLNAGQAISSPSGKFKLIMQTDGNLVESGPTGQAIFASDTSGNNHAIMQDDGNLVVYSESEALWSSGTTRYPGTYLQLNNRGMLDLRQNSSGSLIRRLNDRMVPGQTLTPNSPRIYSPNGFADLRMQSDGNLVEYDGLGDVLFATNVTGRGNQAIMQRDGNLVVYNRQHRAVWATNTEDHPGASLAVSREGDLVITYQGYILWSHSAQERPMPFPGES